ncbi:MAG: hypothetical protein BGO67_11900 [Alphaproteobacteria bacterium 41-28]|nr:MAG: hypothetical protein BGO67_11900 [Alphaproteobacteria bacterium 41-28]
MIGRIILISLVALLCISQKTFAGKKIVSSCPTAPIFADNGLGKGQLFKLVGSFTKARLTKDKLDRWVLQCFYGGSTVFGIAFSQSLDNCGFNEGTAKECTGTEASQCLVQCP